MLTLRNSFVFLLSLLMFSQAEAQLSALYSVKIHGGYLAAHRQNLEHLINEHSFGFNAEMRMPVNTKSGWEHLFGLPYFGFSYSAISLGNPEELGWGNGLAFCGYWALNTKKKRNIWWKFGAGPGMVTKYWNRSENHQNTLIGARFNAFIVTGVDYSIRITNKLNMLAGIQISHFSNASTSQPNLGANLITLNTGLQFGQRDNVIRKSTQANDSISKKNQIVVSLGGNFKENLADGGKRYAAASLLIEYQHDLNLKMYVTGGVNTMWNSGLEQIHLEEYNESTVFNDWIQAGLKIGVGWRFGRWNPFIQQGVYVFSKHFQDGILFHRVGVHFNVNQNWFINTSLKTHFFKADYAEFGVGRRFTWQK
jgi:hypothetical protein